MTEKEQLKQIRKDKILAQVNTLKGELLKNQFNGALRELHMLRLLIETHIDINMTE